MFNAGKKKKKLWKVWCVSCCQVFCDVLCGEIRSMCSYDAIDKLNSWGGTEHKLMDNILWPHAYDDSPVRIKLSRDQTWCNIWREPQNTAVHSHRNHFDIVWWHKIPSALRETVQTCRVTSSRDEYGDAEQEGWFGRVPSNESQRYLLSSVTENKVACNVCVCVKYVCECMWNI